MNMSVYLFFVFIIMSQTFVARASEKDGVFEKIKSGLQKAKSYLETAKEIADLVSNSLGHRNNNNNNNNNNINNNNNNNRKTNKNNNNEKRGDDGNKNDRISKGPEAPNLISGFFRLLGLDSPRIAAIAVNSVIFLAQMISSLFDVKPKLEESRSRSDEAPFNPIEFIVENKDERVQSLLQQAQDPALPGQLIDRLDGIDSACVRLLMCKSSPIILAAQNSLRNKTSEARLDITSWLPNMEDFEDNADGCDEKHFDCILFPEST